MNDLLKKLQSMGLKVEKLNPTLTDLKAHPNLKKTLNGYWIERNAGRVFVREKIVLYGNKYGQVVINKNRDHNDFSEFWDNESFSKSPLSDFLFIDTETSGLSLGSGTLIFLFGACFFSETGLVINQFFLDNPAEELVFISEIENLIKKHRILFSYNGKSFDIPMLRTRMILNKLDPIILNLPHIDLLHFARMLWRTRMENRRLGDIESEILGFRREDNEIPGWLIPQIYRDYLSSRDPELLKGVFSHNECDVISLAVLFLLINSNLKDIQGQIPDDQISIGKIFQKRGDLEQAHKIISDGISKKGIENIDDSELLKFGALLKRMKKWSDAGMIWKEASQHGSSAACIELAIFYEHNQRDINNALFWAKKAGELMVQNVSEKGKAALYKRILRLERKLNEG